MPPSVETFPAKRLLTPTSYSEEEFYAADYNLNLYRGCNHGCIYCDTRSECYRIDRFDTVRVKKDCIPMLESELRQKKKPGIVSMGAASDPYNAPEEELQITRQALLLLRRYNFGVGIPTKGSLIARDADVLAKMGRAAPVRVSFSITTVDDDLAALIEPGAPSSTKRFQAMGTLAQAGVFTGTWINPMLPFLTDSRENLRAVIAQTADSGGRFAVCHFGMTLRTGNREYFYATLDAQPRFRGIKERYADAFGLSYYCSAQSAETLYALFQEECERHGLVYRFGDVNRAMRKGCPAQMTLF